MMGTGAAELLRVLPKARPPPQGPEHPCSWGATCGLDPEHLPGEDSTGRAGRRPQQSALWKWESCRLRRPGWDVEPRHQSTRDSRDPGGQRWHWPRALGTEVALAACEGTEVALAELWPSAPLCRTVLGQQRWGHPEAGTWGRGLLRMRTQVTLCSALGAGSGRGTWGHHLSREAQCALVPRVPPQGPTSLLGSTKHRNGGPPAGPGQGGDQGRLAAPSLDLSPGPEAAPCGERPPPGISPGPAPPARALELWEAS